MMPLDLDEDRALLHQSRLVRGSQRKSNPFRLTPVPRHQPCSEWCASSSLLMRECIAFGPAGVDGKLHESNDRLYL